MLFTPPNLPILAVICVSIVTFLTDCHIVHTSQYSNILCQFSHLISVHPSLHIFTHLLSVFIPLGTLMSVVSFHTSHVNCQFSHLSGLLAVFKPLRSVSFHTLSALSLLLVFTLLNTFTSLVNFHLLPLFCLFASTTLDL